MRKVLALIILTSFYIYSITYYAYNRYFLKNKVSNEIYGADEKVCAHLHGALSLLGGGFHTPTIFLAKPREKTLYEI